MIVVSNLTCTYKMCTEDDNQLGRGDHNAVNLFSSDWVQTENEK